MSGQQSPGKAEENRCLTFAQLQDRVKGLKLVFDEVRIVDPSIHRKLTFDTEGSCRMEPGYCFDFWNMQDQCVNCIAARTLLTKKGASKFEFDKDEIYLMETEYLEVDGRPCVLESILHLDDAALVDAYGKNEFAARISQVNDRMFSDSLTRVRNRRFFDEQAAGLTVKAAAIVDIDNLQEINDNWQSRTGDAVLQTVAMLISMNVRKTDLVLRYGDDAFLIAFQDIPRDIFTAKLKSISSGAVGAAVMGHPQIRFTLSIGGVYGEGMLKDLSDRAYEILQESKAQGNAVIIRD